MGIRLDWEIEAERDHQERSGGEDPETRRKRRRARIRFILAVALLLLLIGSAVGAVLIRLRQVDQQKEQVLRDSVTAEVAALRLGDHDAFMRMQRSASDQWIQEQEANFTRYQALKRTETVILSGNIIDATVDGMRARVELEEIINGVPYERVWFYWFYADTSSTPRSNDPQDNDGWRHVPPDYTFWGDARTVQADNVLVRYNAVDEGVAQKVAPQVSSWLTTGCAVLACSSIPRLTVEIVPNPTLQAGWSPADLWTLQIPSPYVTAGRMDMPFDSSAQVSAANVIAERLVGDFNPTYPADAYYLRQAIISWLVKRFAQVETNSFLVSSLAEHFGDAAVGMLLHNLQPTSNVSIIASVTGTTLDGANLDWRDFLTWRLTVENDLIKRQDQANFLGLYDTSDTTVRDKAYARYAAGASSEAAVVMSAIAETAPNGTPQLRAVVQTGAQQSEVTFRLADGIWRRAS